jgi:hypothetical protein
MTAHIKYSANHQVRFDYFDWPSASQLCVPPVFGKWRWGKSTLNFLGEIVDNQGKKLGSSTVNI